MNLFELSAKLRLDASEYEKGLSDAENSANSFAAGGLSKLAGAAKAGVKAVAAVGTAAAGAGATVFKLAGKAAATGDNIDKMSQKMGISAKAYQEWDFILQHSGSSIDSMQRGMVTLQKKAVDNAEAFNKLGISQEQLASMSTEDLFAATIEGLQGMGEGAERTALASELLGGAAKELGPLLNTSAGETDKMRQAVHDLGGVMSDDAVKSAAKYQDALQDMQTATSGFVRGAAEEAIPAVTNAFRTLTKFVTGPQGKALQKKLGDIIKIIAEKAAVAIPRLVSFLGDVVRAVKDNIALIGGLIVAIKAIRSPVSAAVTAVGLLVGAFGLMKLTAQDVDIELENLSESEKELVKNARDASDAFDESMGNYAQAVSGIDTEMANVQSAWDTLKGYVDENGKIAAGHEQEVSDLLAIINEALGTQYALNGDMIEQYQEMSAEVDKLIEKQWAQKLLDARSESYNMAKSQLEDAQKRLGIAKVELDTKQKTYEEIRNNKAALEETMRTQRDVLDALGNELDLLDQGTDAYEDKAAELNAANIAYNESVDAMERLEEAEKDAQFALGMQASAWREASEDVDKLVGEIGRYDEAYSAFLEGNYTDAKEILESDIAYRWKHLEKGQKVDKAQLEQMKRDYAILYAAYEDYWKKLEAGQDGYNKEELHRLREQMLDLNVIIQDQLAIAEENGEQFGKNVGSGIISGLDKMKTGVKNKAGDVVRVMFSEMNKVAQIKSPSRRGRAIGKNIGGSVGLGLDDSYDGVVKTADDFTEGIFGALDKDAGNTSFVTAGSGGGFGEMLGVLRDIRDNIGNEIVLQDGTIVGWMDKQLGRIAARKVRGTA